MEKLYVQYGCGLSAPKEWLNFDASPTLRIQKIPILRNILKRKGGPVFPSNVLYGDVIKGLPVAPNSCDAVYCSHTLEHFSLEDFRIVLKNTYKILKPGGTFRMVLPDLEYLARSYLKSLDNGDTEASFTFMKDTMLGLEKRPRGIKGLLITYLGNADHLWMWDKKSLSKELENASFKDIRVCSFNDSADPIFHKVEDPERFENALALECKRV